MSTRAERLPWWVADHWRSFREQRGASSDRALAGIGAAESMLRHATAVLIAASGELPPALAEVPARSVTMGQWAQALGEAVARVDPDASAGLRAVAPSLIGRPRGGQSPVQTALRTLLDVRNRTLHSRDTLSDSEWVMLAAALNDLVGLLEGLLSLPIFFVEQCALREDGRYASVLVAVGPVGDEMLADVGPRVDIPLRRAFVLFPDGTVRSVEPWIHVARYRGSHHQSMRLVQHFEKGHCTYRDDPTPRAFQATSTGGAVWSLPPAFIERLREPTAQDKPSLSGIHVRREIGRGASGVVYAATSERSDLPNQLAVKVLRAELSKPGPARERFRREARVLQRLDIPGVIRAFDLEEDEAGRLCLLLELARGRSVQGLLDAAEDRPGPDQVVDLARGVLAILARVHAQGVVHRDIKPANLWIADDGTVRILDFGIATLDDEIGLTRTFDSLGTPSWAAPEQSRGARVDARADLYAVGRLLGALLKPEPDQLGALAVARWATAADQDSRPASAETMLAALEVASGDERRQPLVVGEILDGRSVEQVFRLGDSWCAKLRHVELGRKAFAVVCLGEHGERAARAAPELADPLLVGIPRLGLSLPGTRVLIIQTNDPHRAVALRDALVDGVEAAPPAGAPEPTITLDPPAPGSAPPPLHGEVSAPPLAPGSCDGEGVVAAPDPAEPPAPEASAAGVSQADVRRGPRSKHSYLNHPVTITLGVGVAALLGGPVLAGAALLVGAGVAGVASQAAREGTSAPEAPASRLAAATPSGQGPPASVEELRERLFDTLLSSPLFAHGTAEPYAGHQRVFLVMGRESRPKLMVGFLDAEPSWLRKMTFPQPKLKKMILDISPDGVLIVWPGGGWCYSFDGRRLQRRENLDFFSSLPPGELPQVSSSSL